MTEKFENGASFLPLGLPSTLIRHENGAFQETLQTGGIWNRWLVAIVLVSFAAVFWDVTQSSPERLGWALRDIPKNGCEGD